jgi:hypothetical protein
MASKIADEPVLRELAAFAGVVREAGRRSAGTRWDRAVESVEAARHRAEPTPLGVETFYWAQDLFDTLDDAADLVLAPRWVDVFATRMSDSYVQGLRRKRDRLVKSLQEMQVRHVERMVKQTVSALTREVEELEAFLAQSLKALESRGFNQILMAVLIELARAGRLPSSRWQQMLSRAKSAVLLDREPAAGPVAEGNAPHPTLQMGLTFGAYPAPEKYAPPAGSQTYESDLPGSRAVVYDLPTLLRGVSGVNTSGVNYTLVKQLDTIRFLAEGDLASETSDCQFARLDADRPRPIRFGAEAYALQDVLKGPSPTLAAYHRLAETVMKEPEGGVQIGNLKELLTSFEGEEDSRQEPDNPISGSETPRAGREYSRMDRKAARTPPEDAALFVDQSVEWVAQQRHEFMQARLERMLITEPLPGSQEARRGELALTVFLQAKRLQERLMRSRKRVVSVDRAVVLQHILTSEAAGSASLKMTAAAVGRGRAQTQADILERGD